MKHQVRHIRKSKKGRIFLAGKRKRAKIGFFNVGDWVKVKNDIDYNIEFNSALHEISDTPLDDFVTTHPGRVTEIPYDGNRYLVSWHSLLAQKAYENANYDIPKVDAEPNGFSFWVNVKNLKKVR